jgi:hypothetical protein
LTSDEVDIRKTTSASDLAGVVGPGVTVSVENALPEPTSAMKRWVMDSAGAEPVAATEADTTLVSTPYVSWTAHVVAAGAARTTVAPGAVTTPAARAAGSRPRIAAPAVATPSLAAHEIIVRRDRAPLLNVRVRSSNQ